MDANIVLRFLALADYGPMVGFRSLVEFSTPFLRTDCDNRAGLTRRNDQPMRRVNAPECEASVDALIIDGERGRLRLVVACNCENE